MNTFNKSALLEVIPILQETDRLQAIEQAIKAYNGDTYVGLVSFLESTTGYKGESA